MALELTKEWSTIITNETKGKYTALEFWCQGSSGAILASLVIAQLKEKLPMMSCNINHIKKDNEVSHSSELPVFSNNKNTFHIVIDDFISTGATINRVTELTYKSYYWRTNKLTDFKLNMLIVSGHIVWSRLNYQLYDFVVCEVINYHIR